MENKRIVIIDGNSLLNRAYYAMQRPMITKDGTYTQGIYGFINMLNKIRNDYSPGYMAIAFDLKAPTFRHKAYDGYKAGRKPMPPELAMQVPILKQIIDAMNITRLEIEGYEADDIIGTVAKTAEEKGMEPLIITGDKDELQLATDRTTVIITRKGISEFEAYDREAFIAKYGFTPTQFIDYKGLMGDQSDNIPGLPGVGEKTASKLIKEYGSVEGLLEHADELKGRVKKAVDENAELATKSKWLATIVTDVPLEDKLGFDIEENVVQEADREKLVEIYLRLEFNSFLKNMDAAPEPEAENKYEELNVDRVIVRTRADLALIDGAVQKGGFIVMKVFGDDSHTAVPHVTGVSLLVDKEYFYIDTKASGVLEGFCTILNEKKPAIMGHDLKSDYYMLKWYGLGRVVTGFDTAVAQYVLDPGRSNYEMNVLSEEYFRESISPEKDLYEGSGQIQMSLGLPDEEEDRSEEFAEYGLKWCALSAQMTLLQQARLEEEKLTGVLYDIELPLIEVMAAMEFEGFSVDRSELEKAGANISGRVDELTRSIYELAGEEFNIKSPKQLGPILFEKLGLKAGKKTKSGYSTNAETLEKIKDDHPIVPMILEYRMLTKLSGTYIDGLLPLIAGDGKIHAHFNQTVTATGRISSSDPNLQNIPVRQELGRGLRRAFVPKEGCVLTGADYSQIELRVLAHMSKDPALIDSFNKGEDIHKATAARVLGIPEDEITPEERSRAKAVNFGIIYGMSAFGLSSEIHVTRKEAEDYIKNYFEKHKAVKDFMDEQVAYCKKKGFVRTMMGRKRRISEITASNYMVRQMGERLAMNSPIQGSAADIIKIAMVRVYNALEGFKSRLILQVHDELIIETYDDEKEAVAELLRTSMEEAVKMAVRPIVDLNVADSWFGLK